MNHPSLLQRSFAGWKMWLGISIGLLVASWMLYSALSTQSFVKAEIGRGTHRWVDVNANKRIDFANPQEFVSDDHGQFRLQTITDAFNQIKWNNSSFLWLALAIVFVVGRDFFYMLRIRLLTKGQLNWKSSFNVIMLWEFASALSPGVVGGVAVAMFILNREKIAMGRASAIVLLTALMDNLFYVLLIPFVFLFVNSAQLFPDQTIQETGVQFVFWLGFSFFLTMSLILIVGLFLVPNSSKYILVSLCRLPFLNRFKNNAEKTGSAISDASKEFKQEKPLFWLKVFLTTCGSWISRFLVINALLNAFIQLGFVDNILILGKQLVLWLLMRVSPTPGGSGVAEYAFGELLANFGQSALLLAVLALVWRLISYFPYLFIGAILLPRWLKK